MSKWLSEHRKMKLPDDIRKSLATLACAGFVHLSFGADAPPKSVASHGATIGFSVKDSAPAWPPEVKAPEGAPDILLIMLDDVGFGDASTFGGPAQTPSLDGLAAQGLRYNQFHTTGVCSSTRATLLSGRNHHRMGFGAVGESGYPGYNGIWKKSTVSVAEVLRRNGYSTAAFGKWHNTPTWEITPVGPFDRWPTGLGFDYYYGNMLGWSSQWYPPLWRNTSPVEPPSTPEQGYHLTTDLTDEAIRWIHTHESIAPQKPYFVYFSTGAAHTPHQVAAEWIDKYRGQFDGGWDELRERTFARQKELGVIPANAELTPRPKELPAWDSLSSDEKRLFARQMEIFAAFVAQTDHEIGRLVRAVHEGPHGDNTLILYIVGDNGDEGMAGVDGSADLLGGNNSVAYQLKHIDELGGPLHDSNIYAAAWAWAGSTPFEWMKHVASHFGATRNPLVISWPARIRDFGGMRTQFTHVNDVAPTLYEIAKVRFPTVIDGIRQLPLDGVSFADSFASATAPSRHHVQYFEQEGNRAIYRDGWLAAARHTVPWIQTPGNPGSDFSHDSWELYHVAEDFSEAHDLAAQYPGKLRALRRLFDAQARKNDVYPLGVGVQYGHPWWASGKRTFTFHEGFPSTPANLSGLDFRGSHRITANVTIPAGGAQGVIVAYGSRNNGFTLYVKDNRLVYERNFFDASHIALVSKESLPAGSVELAFELTGTGAKPADGGIGRLYINGRAAGEAKFAHLDPLHSIDNFDIGRDSASPVSTAYRSPFTFTGRIQEVRVQLGSSATASTNLVPR